MQGIASITGVGRGSPSIILPAAAGDIQVGVAGGLGLGLGVEVLPGDIVLGSLNPLPELRVALLEELRVFVGHGAWEGALQKTGVEAVCVREGGVMGEALQRLGRDRFGEGENRSRTERKGLKALQQMLVLLLKPLNRGRQGGEELLSPSRRFSHCEWKRWQAERT